LIQIGEKKEKIMKGSAMSKTAMIYGFSCDIWIRGCDLGVIPTGEKHKKTKGIFDGIF